jgi:phage baseplate assembly protein W
MIPKFEFVVSNMENSIQSSKTYKLDSFNGRITRKIDELESIKQAVFKILQTERFENVIYDANYGVELAGFIGKPKDFVKNDIERTIKDALLADERILAIESFNVIDDVKDNFKIEFKINSIFGNIDFESVVRI